MISVVVPVYRVEKYLPACINSVLAQSYADFELLLIDDGSPDSCGDICEEYAKKDARVRVIHQQNGGLSAARNTGTANAHGDYIFYLDSDDVISPNCLEVMHRIAQETGARTVVCRYEKISDDDELLPQPEEQGGVECLSGEDAAALIVEKHLRYAIVASCKLYARELFPLLEYPAGKLHEDEYVTYKVLYASRKVAVTQMRLYGYRVRSGSIMASYNPKRAECLKAFDEAVEYFDGCGSSRLAAAARKRRLLRYQIEWYKVYSMLGERKDLLEMMHTGHEKLYKSDMKSIKKICSLSESISICAYRISPKLYALIAGLYVKLFPEE